MTPRITEDAKAEARLRLLEAAAAHFARQGLDGASIDAIAIDAGYAKGTIYNYFEGKTQLFLEVIAEGARRAASRYAKVESRGTVRDRLIALAEADVSVVRDEEAFQKVVVREALSFRPETYPAIVAHLAPYLDQVEAVMADGTRAGEIRGDRPTPQLALLFVGTLALLYVQHWGSGGAWPSLDEIPTLAVTDFLDGAAPRGST
ncbi:MAG: TetR/AcrR family transcriptional regulator [Gemmatimonadetes bacterium]|jgi:AcrR family transcriptional regulator|nr:TetR/AcrR family transcriptional regulator [Gemmatimonadota bacterium]